MFCIQAPQAALTDLVQQHNLAIYVKKTQGNF